MLGPDDFVGKWSVDRFIDDRYAGQTGSFKGTATLTALSKTALKYVETGKLILGAGFPLSATRDYIWCFGSDRVSVEFSDGRPFHSFFAEGKSVGTDHPCGDDFYKVSYDFEAWPNWMAVWTVAGPRKNYTSTTQYSRD